MSSRSKIQKKIKIGSEEYLNPKEYSKYQNRKYQEIKEYLKCYKINIARRAFNEFQKEFPSEIKTLRLEAKFLIRERNYEGATERLEAIDDKDAFSKLELVKLGISLGEEKKAWEAFKSLTEEDKQVLESSEPDYAYRQAYCYFANKDRFDFSIKYVKNLTKLDKLIYEYDKEFVIENSNRLARKHGREISPEINQNELLDEMERNLEVSKEQIGNKFLTAHAYKRHNVGTIDGVEVNYLIVHTIPGTREIVNYYPSFTPYDLNVCEKKEKESECSIKRKTKTLTGLERFKRRYNVKN